MARPVSRPAASPNSATTTFAPSVGEHLGGDAAHAAAGAGDDRDLVLSRYPPPPAPDPCRGSASADGSTARLPIGGGGDVRSSRVPMTAAGATSSAAIDAGQPDRVVAISRRRWRGRRRSRRRRRERGHACATTVTTPGGESYAGPPAGARRVRGLAGLERRGRRRRASSPTIASLAGAWSADGFTRAPLRRVLRRRRSGRRPCSPPARIPTSLAGARLRVMPDPLGGRGRPSRSPSSRCSRPAPIRASASATAGRAAPGRGAARRRRDWSTSCSPPALDPAAANDAGARRRPGPEAVRGLGRSMPGRAGS